MALKLDVKVPAEGGIELGAWLFLPKGMVRTPLWEAVHWAW